MTSLFAIQYNLLLLILILIGLINVNNGDGNGKPDRRPEAASLLHTDLKLSPENLPIFPERDDAVYFIVAVSGGAKSWARTLARTLLDMGAPFSNPQGPPLRPIYVDLPQNGRFSVKVLTTLCEQIDGVPIAGMIVVGDGQSARSIALSGNSMKIPVLWAKGGTAHLHSGSEVQNYLQATLQPSAKEILEAIRAIFLQTHWHSFFVLSDIGSTMVLGGSMGMVLKKAPLSPTILPLSSNKDDVFRQLAKISRSTRGIVLLLCDLKMARRVMAEAQRLNMVGGHFIWIWADTSSTAEFYQPHNFGSAPNVEEKEAIITAKENYDNHMDEYMERKSKYDHLDMPPTETRRPQNNTRYKQTNINRFHHIIGLRKGTDDDYENSRETDSIVGPKSFLKSVKSNKDEKIPMKEKRFNYNQKSTSSINNRSRIKQNDNSNNNNNNNFNSDENEFTSSVENSKANSLLHIKNINSDEFNANYYDSSSSSASIDSRNENFENEYVELSANINKNSNGDFIDEFENVYGDYFGASYETMENVNPFVPTTTTTTRRTPIQPNQQPTPPAPIITTTVRNFNLNQQVNSKISATKSMEKPKAQTKSLKSGKTSKIQDANKNQSNKSDNVNVDVDESGENTNDLKAKRANNYPTNPFNISSHVLFHHFKDFPVGLLALKPVKMNVDRHFIRSAIRLFASTWSRVDKEDEQKFMNRNRGKVVMNWDEWRNEYDEYEDNYGNNQKSTTSNQKSNKNNNNPNVNSRYSNRGRKFKRDTVEITNKTSISNSVNSTLSSQTNNNINVNLTHYIVKQNNDELLSGLINNTKSNNNNTSSTTTNNNTKNNQNTINKETVVDVPLRGSIEVQKRQNTWWSGVGGSYRVKPDRQDRPKGGRGTPHYRGGCFGTPNRGDVRRAESFSKYIREAVMLALSGKNIPGGMIEKPLISNFEILNLVPVNTKVNERKDQFKKMTDQKLLQTGSKWRRVGLVLGRKVHLDTIVWPGGDIVVSGLSARARSVFRVVTCLSPPFVMESSLDEDGLCLRGLPCHRLSTSGKHNLTLMFNSIETKERLEEDAVEHGNQIPINEDHKSNDKVSYITRCCYGLSMDLLENIASELGFEYHLYIVRDELFGTKQVLKRYDQQNQYQYSDRQENLELARDRERDRDKDRKNKTGNFLPPNKRMNDNFVWNGIVGDLVSGSADMSFAPLSVSKARAEVIDFSVPFYHSGVSLLAAPKTKDDIPLLAFLLPFSPELWIAIFTFLNITAVAVAVYEWLSPFGLNPWGRQRSKNFSMSSALWVMWGLLCGHLVAFKAPKSWPNKFLINVWGGFSVIFVASYTANIAALIAGLFFHNLSHNYDTSLFNQRVGAPQASAAESYVQKYDKQLWEHMKKYSLRSIEEGIRRLKNGSIDLLMADAPILDYYRATDHGCTLRQIGDNYMEDTYAIGMTKGFPLKESISALIAKYSSNGYLDILAEKWYGGLPCYKSESDIEIVQPRPLGVAAVAGVFLLLGLGMILGVLILIFEHMFFKYTLPILRHQPKGTIWRSRNIMFFSQKLYRFINCVELVSPHHAARELVHTLRQGHITSLFQKSIKRKEDEQRRRRKSKAQFFEMIQEIRRVQQEEREQPTAPTLAVVQECEPDAEGKSISSQSSIKPKVSPKGKLFSLKKDGKSRSNSSGLNVRRFSTDSILGERLDTIGRRLSRDITNSPPDLGHRFETFGKSSSSKFDTFSGNVSIHKSADNIVDNKSKFDTFSGNIEEIKPALPAKKNAKNKQKRKPLNLEVFDTKTDKMTTFENQATLPLRDSVREPIKESVRESLQPPIFQLDSSKAVLRERLHEELKAKYGKNKKSLNSVKPPRVPSANSHRQSNNISNDSYLKVQSSDALNVRPTPSPRQTKNYDYSTNDDDDDDDDLDPMYASIQPKTNSRPKNNISLTKLSKEDLLKLSESTESEIHEFLNNSSAQTKSPDPT